MLSPHRRQHFINDAAEVGQTFLTLSHSGRLRPALLPQPSLHLDQPQPTVGMLRVKDGEEPLPKATRGPWRAPEQRFIATYALSLLL